jgi:hypothetical protein
MVDVMVDVTVDAKFKYVRLDQTVNSNWCKKEKQNWDIAISKQRN